MLGGLSQSWKDMYFMIPLILDIKIVKFIKSKATGSYPEPAEGKLLINRYKVLDKINKFYRSALQHCTFGQ